MPELFKRTLKRATCRVEILNWNSNYDMRFELFNRLNTGGSPLTPQEIRNCIYRDISTKFNDFLKDIAENPDFRELICLSDEQIELLYHEELALRFISLYKNRDNVKTGLAHHMTEFMKQALNDDVFDYEKYKTIFANVFSLLKPLGKDVFRKRGNRKGGRFITTIYDIVTIGIAENYECYKSKDIQIIKDKIAENESKIDYIIKSSGGNDQKGRIINRLDTAQEIFGNHGC
jgi:hypothetical protein